MATRAPSRKVTLLKALSVSAFAASVVTASSMLPACAAGPAADPSATAMAQFKAKKYVEGAASFRKAIAAHRADANLYYYYALCLHYSGDVNGAKAIYNQIQQYFPGSAAATSARTALGAMVPAGQTPPPVTPAPVSPTGPLAREQEESMETPNISGLPSDAKIYFHPQGGNLMVDAQFNGRPIEGVFDTGAEAIVIGRNHLQQLGLPLPTGAPNASSVGVGDGGVQRCWIVKMNVSVGSMTRSNVRVLVQESLPSPPLIGQDFYRGMTYGIDNAAKCVTLTRDVRSGSIYADPSKAADAVPFVREGNEMVVSVKVNGRPIQMIFDTGASGVVLSKEQAQSVGLVIPEDAQFVKSQGIAGETTGRLVYADIKVGQVEKRGMPVMVGVQTGMRPLLGQDFFGDMRYTINEKHHVIHLSR